MSNSTIKLEIVTVDFNLLKVKIIKGKEPAKVYDLEFYLNDEDFIVESTPELISDFSSKAEWILRCVEKLTKKDPKCKDYLSQEAL